MCMYVQPSETLLKQSATEPSQSHVVLRKPAVADKTAQTHIVLRNRVVFWAKYHLHSTHPLSVI